MLLTRHSLPLAWKIGSPDSGRNVPCSWLDVPARSAARVDPARALRLD